MERGFLYMERGFLYMEFWSERLHGISKEDALYTVNGMAGPNISLSDL